MLVHFAAHRRVCVKILALSITISTEMRFGEDFYLKFYLPMLGFQWIFIPTIPNEYKIN
jgi:hypothetical protein